MDNFKQILPSKNFMDTLYVMNTREKTELLMCAWECKSETHCLDGFWKGAFASTAHRGPSH